MSIMIFRQSQFGSNFSLFLQSLNLAQLRSARALRRIVLLVNCHNAGASQAEVVLEGVFQIGDLPLSSDAPQLPAKLSTLRKTCSAEGVALADEPA